MVKFYRQFVLSHENSVGFDVHIFLLLLGFADLERLELSETPLLYYVFQIWDLGLVCLDEF